MSDDRYNAWRRLRAEDAPPADFADRVLSAVRRESPPRPMSVAARFLASPAVRVAACALACLVGLYRMASVIAVFFPP